MEMCTFTQKAKHNKTKKPNLTVYQPSQYYDTDPKTSLHESCHQYAQPQFWCEFDGYFTLNSLANDRYM